MVFKIVIAVFKANKTAILMKDDFDKKSLFAIVISELCQIDVDSYIHTYLPTYLRTYIHTYVYWDSLYRAFQSQWAHYLTTN